MQDLPLFAPPMPTPSRFRREEPIAVGAIATTYRAHDLVAGRDVALTLVHPEHAADPAFIARFERETRLLAAIDHPNVVRLTAHGCEHGVLYVAREDLPGRPLSDVIRERGALGVAEAVELAGQILAGLGAVHAAGMLHLQLSPGAIVVGDDGVARIAEIGIVGLSSGGDRSETTATIEAVRYLAPEQIDGGDVSEATDLYAVGLMLYEVLTGQPAFPGTNPALVRFSHLHAAAPTPSHLRPLDVVESLDAVVLRALDKVPARRFADATQMAIALVATRGDPTVDRLVEQTTIALALPPPEQFVGAEPQPARPAFHSIAESGSPPPRRRRDTSAGWLWPLVLAGAAIALLIGGLVASLAGEPAPEEAVAGVSIGPGEESPTSTPNATALTPTVRVLRASERGEETVSSASARKARTPQPTRTPTPVRTPRPSRTPTASS